MKMQQIISEDQNPVQKMQKSYSTSQTFDQQKIKALYKDMDQLLKVANDFSKYLENKQKKYAKQKYRGNNDNKNSSNQEDKKFDYLSHQPKSLEGGKLKVYQLQALNWMISLYQSRLNGILADDMGLGKTIQTIAFIAYLDEYKNISGKHLIVAPLTTLNNWLRQIKRWLPQKKAILLLATQKQRLQTTKKYIDTNQFDIIVTSYEGIRYGFNKLYKRKWQVFVIDEAHKIKNQGTLISNTVKFFQSRFKLLLTGTPLSNRLKELWCLLNFILPQIFWDNTLFDSMSTYVQSLTGQQKHRTQAQVAKKFHQLIDPFLMRRTKKQVEKQLPKKYENCIYVPLTRLQITMYKNYLKYKNFYNFQKHQKYYNNQVQLRKICNHPYIFPNIQPEDAQPYGEHIINSSGKMIVLDKLLTRLIGQGHKVLIFSQFTCLLDILQDYCVFRSFKYCRIDGHTKINEREEQMNTFNTDINYKIFLLSTRAGGLGINLVSADIVIIYDIDWNPQNDNQAMDRAYRIGQTKQVHVFKLICQHTIQQRMSQIQKIKLIWDELVIQKGSFFVQKNNADIIDYDKMSKLGQGQIFKIQIKNISQQDIDNLIKRGIQIDNSKNQKYKQILQQRLQQGIQNRIYNPYQILQDKEKDQITQLKDEDTADNQMGQYLERRRNLTYKNNQKHKNQQLPQYQLFTKQDSDQYNKYLKQLLDENLQQKQQIKKLVDDILKRGFTNWKQKQTNRFINANYNIHMKNYQKIAQQIQTKTPQQVRQYSIAFFQRAENINGLKKKYKKILANQKQIQKTSEINQLIEWKKLVINDMEPLIEKKLMKHLTHLQQHILNELLKQGLDNIKQIQNHLKYHKLFSFNKYYLTRQSGWIKARRIPAIFTYLEKQKKQRQQIGYQIRSKLRIQTDNQYIKALKYFNLDSSLIKKQVQAMNLFQKQQKRSKQKSKIKQINTNQAQIQIESNQKQQNKKAKQIKKSKVVNKQKNNEKQLKNIQQIKKKDVQRISKNNSGQNQQKKDKQRKDKNKVQKDKKKNNKQFDAQNNQIKEKNIKENKRKNKV